MAVALMAPVIRKYLADRFFERIINIGGLTNSSQEKIP